jgi:hypothetical protein
MRDVNLSAVSWGELVVSGWVRKICSPHRQGKEKWKVTVDCGGMDVSGAVESDHSDHGGTVMWCPTKGLERSGHMLYATYLHLEGQ